MRWRFSRRLTVRIGVATLVLCAVGGGIFLVNSFTQDQEPSWEVVRTIGPAGEEINAIQPRFPEDPGTPTTYDSYRLLPFGYRVTPTPYAEPDRVDLVPVPANVDRRSGALLREAPFYLDIDPASVPGGFAYSPPEVVAMSGAQAGIIQWVFRGSLQGRIVVQRGYFNPPWDVHIPCPECIFELETATIMGRAAIIESATTVAPNRIRFVEGNVFTLIEGDVEFEPLMNLAEDIVRGSSLDVRGTPVARQ